MYESVRNVVLCVCAVLALIASLRTISLSRKESHINSIDSIRQDWARLSKVYNRMLLLYYDYPHEYYVNTTLLERRIFARRRAKMLAERDINKQISMQREYTSDIKEVVYFLNYCFSLVRSNSVTANDIHVILGGDVVRHYNATLWMTGAYTRNSTFDQAPEARLFDIQRNVKALLDIVWAECCRVGGMNPDILLDEACVKRYESKVKDERRNMLEVVDWRKHPLLSLRLYRLLGISQKIPLTSITNSATSQLFGDRFCINERYRLCIRVPLRPKKHMLESISNYQIHTTYISDELIEIRKEIEGASNRTIRKLYSDKVMPDVEVAKRFFITTEEVRGC